MKLNVLFTKLYFDIKAANFYIRSSRLLNLLLGFKKYAAVIDRLDVNKSSKSKLRNLNAYTVFLIRGLSGTISSYRCLKGKRL